MRKTATARPTIEELVQKLLANRADRKAAGKYEEVLNRPVHVGAQRCGGGRRLHAN